MDALSGKLNTYAGRAVSSVNEFKRKQQERHSEDRTDSVTDGSTQVTAAAQRRDIPARDLNLGFAFGTDSTRGTNSLPPPPVGWRPDLPNTPGQLTRSSIIQPSRHDSGSSDSLYQGDVWSKLWFQRVMILTLIRLVVFIRKVYEDYKATKTYGAMPDYIGQFIISAATLILPTAVFTVYRVSRYLQITLPSSRNNSARLSADTSLPADSGIAERSRSSVSPSQRESTVQETRALLNSPIPGRLDEEGYGTARQTPVDDTETPNVVKEETDQASPNQLLGASEQTTVKSSTKELSKRIENFQETVNINKLGNLPDKETTRIAIGTSEQFLHGVLYIFWQLKRQVDVLSYLVDRACLWRKPSEHEKEELSRLQIGSDGLEWFQDFYAAFLAILTQVYILGISWSFNNGTKDGLGMSTTSFRSANTDLTSAQSGTVETGIKFVEDIVAGKENSASSQRDVLIFSEFIVSLFVVSSLLIAVRRRDDGPLTLLLSTLGWGLIFASRIIIIALAFVHIGVKIMIACILIHIIGIAIWVYKIALDSHNGKKGESEEWRWTIEDGKIDEPITENTNSVEMEPTSDSSEPNIERKDLAPTKQWSVVEHLVLLTQIFTLFAVPSLFYWPIMFNLKLHYRPFKYLVLILSENFLLIPAIWYSLPQTSTVWPWYLMIAVGSFSIGGFLFIAIYIACKPSMTEYFARADQLFNEAERAGIYFEFCSRVFRMPDLGTEAFSRLTNQTQKTVDIVEVQVEREE